MNKGKIVEANANNDIMEISSDGVKRGNILALGQQVRGLWGGRLVIFLIFHPMGLAAIIFSLYEMTTRNDLDAQSWLGFIIMLLFGLLLVLGGLAWMFWKTVYTLDRRAGTLLKRSTAFFTFSRKQMPLSDFKSLKLSQLVVSGGRGGTSITYPVELINARGFHHLSLMKSGDHHESRAVAEEVVRFLGIPLEDQHAGVTITPEYLAQADRAEFPGNGIGAVLTPPKPKTMHAVIEEEGKQTVIRIPGFKISLLSNLLATGVLSIIFIVLFYFHIGQAVSEPYRTIAFTVVLIILFVRVLMKSKKQSIEPVLITASSVGLKLQAGEGDKQRTVTMPAAEIRELLLPSSLRAGGAASPNAAKGILAKSDKESIEFGGGLADDEVRYIYALVHNALFPAKQG